MTYQPMFDSNMTPHEPNIVSNDIKLMGNRAPFPPKRPPTPHNQAGTYHQFASILSPFRSQVRTIIACFSLPAGGGLLHEKTQQPQQQATGTREAF
jgi:hypothetical protein